MAKTLFHRHQRVFVKPVGTWAFVERVTPHWVKNVDEPLRITYDVGLGRDFTAGELVSEQVMNTRGRDEEDALLLENWRIFRLRHGGGPHDPTGQAAVSNTLPVVVTDEYDWGGWRVPEAEYDRDRGRIEHQARMIANAPDMLAICKKLAALGDKAPGDLGKRAAEVLRDVYESTAVPARAAE